LQSLALTQTNEGQHGKQKDKGEATTQESMGAKEVQTNG
jgi:hypothetical protein